MKSSQILQVMKNKCLSRSSPGDSLPSSSRQPCGKEGRACDGENTREGGAGSRAGGLGGRAIDMGGQVECSFCGDVESQGGTRCTFGLRRCLLSSRRRGESDQRAAVVLVCGLPAVRADASEPASPISFVVCVCVGHVTASRRIGGDRVGAIPMPHDS